MRKTTVHFYSMTAIDYWPGALTFSDFFTLFPNSFPHFPVMLKEAIQIFQEEGEKGQWEGDFRGDVVIFSVPNELEFSLGFFWKQENNGDAFVVSTVELPHLLPHVYSYQKKELSLPMEAGTLPICTPEFW